MYETILFDLDGTLTDPGMGITNSVMYALKEMGYAVPERKELYKFIGPPLHDSFSQFYGMSEEEAVEAVRQYRVYYRDKGIFENDVYEGVPEMLQALAEAGKHLVLATSKPEEFAKIIMAHYALDKWVKDIAGATMDKARGTKGKVIAYALDSFGIDSATAVMVGDREHDIIGGRENGLPGIGVTFGYGSREELLQSGAVAVADSPYELTKLLLGE